MGENPSKESLKNELCEHEQESFLYVKGKT